MSNLLEQASLVLIPSGYKEDVVYSQIPLDGSGDMTLTRASNGTRVNSAGLVEVCPWNVWEGSNDFSATYWTQYQLTPTTGTTTDIYGNLSTVYKLIGSVTNSYSFINRSSNGSANTAFSVYAKPNGYTKIGISNRSGGAWNFVVDLVTKVVSNIDDSGSSIVSINVVDAVGDWKRIEVVVSTAVQYNLHPLPSNFNSTNFDNVTLNGTDGVWVMASQVNIGSTAKPYFPTTDRLNVPRLTYQNGGGGCPSLLLEKQSTNIAYPSQAFSGFSKSSDVTLTDNNAISPDGTQNATYYFCNTTTTNGYLLPTWSGTSGVQYAVSFYAKAKELNLIFIKNINDTGGQSTVNLSDGTFTLVSGIDSISVSAVGNGWYRITAISTSSTTQISFIPVIKGSANQGVYIWGLQIEQSSYPTSYIPTTSASATRVADACSKTGISSLIGQTQGTLFIDMVPTDVSGQGRYMNIYNASNSSNGWNAIISNGGTPNTFRFYGDGFDFSAGACLLGVRAKVAFAYKNGVLTSAYVNGASVGTLTAVTTGKSYDKLELGSGPFGNDGSCNVNQSIIFPTALTNAELASLTTI